MAKNFVWAIDEDGRPTKCTAKPENRGKGSCKHKFHQNNTQSAHSFFAEHNIKIDDIVFDETEEIVEKKSIFKEDMIELSPYRMTDEEKSELKQILTKKDLREDLETGGYIHFDEPLWNDMDKNYFCKEYGFDRELVDGVLHEEKYIALRDCSFNLDVKEDGDVVNKTFEFKEGEEIPVDIASKLPENTPGVATGLSAMNYVAQGRGFEATKDIYVLPYHMRVGTKGVNGDVVDSETTSLYLSLFNKKSYSEKSRQSAYENLINNKGVADKGYAYKSLSERFKGKKGIFRNNITAFTIPYSGRAVIVPNVDISYDEVSIPTSVAADIFKPTIIENLTKKGFEPEEIRDIFNDAKRGSGKSSPNTSRIIQNALNEENIRTLMNRQPSLHAASIQSFKPVVDGKTSTIGVNPLVCGGFGADFDGDTCALYGINSSYISQLADDEMHPSNFVRTPRDHSSMNMEPTKDAKWGLMNILKQRTN